MSNAADFRNAVAAGADDVAHMPLAFVPAFLGGPQEESLTPEDARLAAERGVTVITLAGPASAVMLPEERDRMRRGLADNLALLLRSGVRVAVGSDNAADPSVDEAALLLETGVVDELGLLRMWTSVTAKAIFPDRAIGALEEGYEASLLALEGNPLEDWDNVRRIRLRVKQGVVLPSQPAP
jgi:imidazolonepropionase-like amidohydrolase